MQNGKNPFYNENNQFNEYNQLLKSMTDKNRHIIYSNVDNAHIKPTIIKYGKTNQHSSSFALYSNVDMCIVADG